MTDSIFTEDELKADATQAEEAAEAGQEAADQRARDEQGRFAPKEAAEPAAEPAEGQDDPEARQQGTVPQGALHAEREKRKGIETELKAAREQLAAIQQMREQIAARQPEPLPAADDPAATEYLRQRVEQQGQQLNRFSQQMDSQAAEQAEHQQLGAVIQASETQFRQERPDYDDAVRHVVEARATELQLYGLPPAQIQQTIAEEALDIVRSAVAQNRNPAELAYEIAKSRGYRPAEGQPQPQGGAAAKVAAIGAARDSSRSLGQAAGSTPQQLNAESIAAMDADEFERLYSTPEGRRMIDNL